MSYGSYFLSEKWLIDSGADISICFNYDQFCYIELEDMHECKVTGSCPLSVFGNVVMRMCVGQFMGSDGGCHPINQEIADVYRVPWCYEYIIHRVASIVHAMVANTRIQLAYISHVTCCTTNAGGGGHIPHLPLWAATPGMRVGRMWVLHAGLHTYMKSAVDLVVQFCAGYPEVAISLCQRFTRRKLPRPGTAKERRNTQKKDQLRSTKTTVKRHHSDIEHRTPSQ